MALKKTDLAVSWELLTACEKNRIDDVRRLISAGSNVNAVHMPKGSLLDVAARLDHDRVVEMLLAAGARPHAPQAGAKTALMHACEGGCDQTVEVLVQWYLKTAKREGVDLLNEEHLDGKSLVHVLLRGGYEHHAIAVLKAGADPYKRDDWSECAIDICAANCLMEVLDYMVRAGVDLSFAEQGYSALHIAAVKNRLESIRFMVENGASTSIYYDVAPNGGIPGLEKVWESAVERYHGVTPILSALNAGSVEAFLYFNELEGRGVSDLFLGRDLLELFEGNERARQLIISKRTQLGVMDALFSGNVVESEDSAMARLRRSTSLGL